MPVLTMEAARAFTADWYDSWNAHDLERVLSHYREDVVFSSPFIARLTGNEDGTVAGRIALGDYFGRALATYPDLHFQPRALFVGATSVVLEYVSVGGLLASEAMEFDETGHVARVLAHYDRLPQ
jgi:hypothetical protein